MHRTTIRTLLCTLALSPLLAACDEPTDLLAQQQSEQLTSRQQVEPPLPQSQQPPPIEQEQVPGTVSGRVGLVGLTTELEGDWVKSSGEGEHGLLETYHPAPEEGQARGADVQLSFDSTLSQELDPQSALTMIDELMVQQVTGYESGEPQSLELGKVAKDGAWRQDFSYQHADGSRAHGSLVVVRPGQDGDLVALTLSGGDLETEQIEQIVSDLEITPVD